MPYFTVLTYEAANKANIAKVRGVKAATATAAIVIVKRNYPQWTPYFAVLTKRYTQDVRHFNKLRPNNIRHSANEPKRSIWAVLAKHVRRQSLLRVRANRPLCQTLLLGYARQLEYARREAVRRYRPEVMNGLVTDYT